MVDDVGVSLGFETSHPDGMGSIAIDLGDVPESEELGGFSVGFVDLPATRAYLAQIASIAIVKRRLVTRVVADNKTQREAQLHFRGSNRRGAGRPDCGWERE